MTRGATARAGKARRQEGKGRAKGTTGTGKRRGISARGGPGRQRAFAPASSGCQHTRPTTTTPSPSKTSTPPWGTWSPLTPPAPQPASAAWVLRAEPARMVAAPAAQEPLAEPAGIARGERSTGGRDWDAIPDPLGGKTLPEVLEVLGHLRVPEEPFARGHVPPAGRGEPGGPLGGLDGPGGPQKGSPGHHFGGVAGPRAGMGSLPGRRGTALRHKPESQ